MSTLEVSDLTKAYGATKVLERISFTLRPGGCTALIGPNGAGKSTLVECIAGLRRIDRGRVSIDHRDVTDDIQALRSLLYICMQNQPAAIFNIPFDITGNREDGTFKRLYSTPVKMKYIVVCLMLSNILFALVSMLLLGSAAAVIHNYRLQIDWRYTGHAIAASFCLLPLGLLSSFIARSARGNMMISMALFYLLCMLSGLFIPYPLLPQKFQSAAFYLPVPHIFSVFLAFTSDIGPIFPQKQSAVILAVYTAVFSILLLVFRRGSRFLND